MGKKNWDPEIGTSNTRKITRQEAKILSDRFYIYRLDEDKSNGIENEEFDRCLHTIGYDCDIHEVREGWYPSLSEYRRQNYKQ